jgi:hypothetical protein
MADEQWRKKMNTNVKLNRKNLLMATVITSLSLAFPSGILGMENLAEKDPDQHVRQLAYGHLPARALHVACHYKLFDPLESGLKTAAEIASGQNLQATGVLRVMRVLANHEIVTMDEDERFSLNENSKALISTAPKTLQPALAKEFNPKRWAAIGNIHYALEEDVVPFEKTYGMSYYKYLETDEEASKAFNKGMRNFSEIEDAQVSSNFPFKDYESYCDVGGGTGGLMAQVLSHCSTTKGILFDLPEGIKDCSMPNITKVGGSFFDFVPKAELYTVKRVMHNWKDAQCTQILKNISQSMIDKEKGRVLIIEQVLKNKMDGSFLNDCDILSMALGGIERTLGGFINLGKSADLELEEQILLPSGVSILVFKHR